MDPSIERRVASGSHQSGPLGVPVESLASAELVAGWVERRSGL